MAQRAMNCRVMLICIPYYVIQFDNPIAAIFRNDPSCFAGSRMSLASCEPNSRETSNQLQGKVRSFGRSKISYLNRLRKMATTTHCPQAICPPTGC
jgi:hypothetical protein